MAKPSMSQVQRTVNPVGRPRKLFICKDCGAEIGKVATRTHKCVALTDSLRGGDTRRKKKV
jgi:ribosomal protein L40E